MKHGQQQETAMDNQPQHCFGQAMLLQAAGGQWNGLL